MARMIGGRVVNRPAQATRPQQQMARALGAPVARSAQQGPRVPHPDRVAPRGRAQAMLTGRQRRMMPQGGMGGVGGGTLDVTRFFGEGAAAAPGQPGMGNLKCNDCGTGVLAGYDAMENPDGMGVLCKNCWADMWVPHNRSNAIGLAGSNTCTMGIRWSKEEWGAIQGIAQATIQELGKVLGRYPGPQDYPTLKAALDPQLGKFKRSMHCKDCKTDVAFQPTADDVPMAGINTQG